MLWAFLVVAAVSWLVVSLIGKEEGSARVALASSPSELWRRAVSSVTRAGRWARGAWHGRSIARGRRPAADPFSSADGEWGRPGLERTTWRDRAVALMELILFVVLLSALFAGVLAAAAMRLGHLHA